MHPSSSSSSFSGSAPERGCILPLPTLGPSSFQHCEFQPAVFQRHIFPAAGITAQTVDDQAATVSKSASPSLVLIRRFQGRRPQALPPDPHCLRQINPSSVATKVLVLVVKFVLDVAPRSPPGRPSIGKSRWCRRYSSTTTAICVCFTLKSTSSSWARQASGTNIAPRCNQLTRACAFSGVSQSANRSFTLQNADNVVQ